MERLQKILARAGIASRRKCEEYITAGRVTVDGQVVRELGAKADPARSVIRCDGERVRAQRSLYFLVNKPRGMVCSREADGGHARVTDLFASVEQRLFTVGRLDADSEGLLIVTNDGALADRLAHPRHGVAKTYRVEIDGPLTPEQQARLSKGVHLAEGTVRLADIRSRPAARGRCQVRVVLRRGLNREIRRAFAAVGRRVRRLTRVAIGRLKAPGLAPGSYRMLTASELDGLREDSGLVGTDK